MEGAFRRIIQAREIQTVRWDWRDSPACGPEPEIALHLQEDTDERPRRNRATKTA